jgi:hypothetical protein
MDFTGDCRVDFADFAVLGNTWVGNDFTSIAAWASEWLDEGSYTLYVNSSGTSGVSITSSTGHGGTTNYSQTLTVGTSVTLTAPAMVSDATFTGWTGDVNSINQTISLAMDADKTVTANYAPATTIIWVSINDPGVSGHENFNGQMSKYLTTNAQYCQYLNAAKAAGLITVYTDNIVYAASDTGHSLHYFYTYAADSCSQITYSGGTFSVRSRDGYSMANHPVVDVSWFGSTAFCNYYGYRLPTEWEWQAVADYDGSYTYGCGTTISQSKANYYDGTNGYSNPLGLTSIPYTSPVGYYPAYGYGMCDMAGNVWEWMSSCYYSDCSYGYRVLRGGSWHCFDYHNCSASSRGSAGPGSTCYDIGFRVCR